MAPLAPSALETAPIARHVHAAAAEAASGGALAQVGRTARDHHAAAKVRDGDADLEECVLPSPPPPVAASVRQLREREQFLTGQVTRLRHSCAELRSRLRDKDGNRAECILEFQRHLSQVADTKQELQARKEDHEYELQQLQHLQEQQRQEELRLKARLEEKEENKEEFDNRIQKLMDRLVMLLSSGQGQDVDASLPGRLTEELQVSLDRLAKKLGTMKSELEKVLGENREAAVNLSEEQLLTKTLHDKLCDMQGRVFQSRSLPSRAAPATAQPDSASQATAAQTNGVSCKPPGFVAGAGAIAYASDHEESEVLSTSCTSRGEDPELVVPLSLPRPAHAKSTDSLSAVSQVGQQRPAQEPPQKPQMQPQQQGPQAQPPSQPLQLPQPEAQQQPVSLSQPQRDGTPAGRSQQPQPQPQQKLQQAARWPPPDPTAALESRLKLVLDKVSFRDPVTRVGLGTYEFGSETAYLRLEEGEQVFASRDGVSFLPIEVFVHELCAKQAVKKQNSWQANSAQASSQGSLELEARTGQHQGDDAAGRGVRTTSAPPCSHPPQQQTHHPVPVPAQIQQPQPQQQQQQQQLSTPAGDDAAGRQVTAHYPLSKPSVASGPRAADAGAGLQRCSDPGLTTSSGREPKRTPQAAEPGKQVLGEGRSPRRVADAGTDPPTPNMREQLRESSREHTQPGTASRSPSQGPPVPTSARDAQQVQQAQPLLLQPHHHLLQQPQVAVGGHPCQSCQPCQPCHSQGSGLPQVGQPHGLHAARWPHSGTSGVSSATSLGGGTAMSGPPSAGGSLAVPGGMAHAAAASACCSCSGGACGCAGGSLTMSSGPVGQPLEHHRSHSPVNACGCLGRRAHTGGGTPGSTFSGTTPPAHGGGSPPAARPGWPGAAPAHAGAPLHPAVARRGGSGACAPGGPGQGPGPSPPGAWPLAVTAGRGGSSHLEPGAGMASMPLAHRASSSSPPPLSAHDRRTTPARSPPRTDTPTRRTLPGTVTTLSPPPPRTQSGGFSAPAAGGVSPPMAAQVSPTRWPSSSRRAGEPAAGPATCAAASPHAGPPGTSLGVPPVHHPAHSSSYPGPAAVQQAAQHHLHAAAAALHPAAAHQPVGAMHHPGAAHNPATPTASFVAMPPAGYPGGARRTSSASPLPGMERSSGRAGTPTPGRAAVGAANAAMATAWR